MAFRKNLILRNPRRGRLQGRTGKDRERLRSVGCPIVIAREAKQSAGGREWLTGAS
jgi:hypothetical protein